MNPDQERLVDLGLEEVLGGAQPPDLSERILAAASEPASEPASEAPPVAQSDSWIVEEVGQAVDVKAKGDTRADESKDGELEDPGDVGSRIEVVEARLLPTTLPPEYADLGPNAPEWARPGELRRRRRRQGPAVLLTAGVLLLSGSAAALYTLHREGVKAELAREHEEGLVELGRDALARARQQLADGREALRSGGGLAALDSVGRAEQILRELEGRGAGDARILDRYDEPVERLGLRLALLRARARLLLMQPGIIDQVQSDLVRLEAASRGDAELDALVHTALGELYLLIGEASRAHESFQEALVLYPRAWRAQVGQARAEVELSEQEDAIVSYGRALTALSEKGHARDELGPDEVEELVTQLLLERSEARLPIGQHERALEEARQALARGAGWRAQLVIARVQEHAGQLLQADEALAAARAAAPTLAEPWRVEGEILLRRGQVEGAGQAVSAALALESGDLEARVLEAEVYEARFQPEEARLRASAIGSQVGRRDWRIGSRVEQLLARLEAIEGNIPAAHEHAKKASALHEESLEGMLLQGEIELDPFFEGQYLDSAERLMKKVLKRSPGSLRARRGLGAVYLQKFVSQPERAQRQLAQALDTDPSDPQTLALMGRSYLLRVRKEPRQARSHKESAARYFGRARRSGQDVRRPEGRAYLAGLRAELAGEQQEMRRQAELWAEAQVAYRFALRALPTQVLAYLGLERIALAQGSHLRAHGYAERALAENPDDSAARILRARLHLENPAFGRSPRDMADVRTLLRSSSAEDAFELRLLRAMQATWEVARKGDAAVQEKAHEVYSALRLERPWDPRVLRAEEGVLSAIEERFRFGDGLRARCKILREERFELETALDQRADQAAKARERASEALAGADGPKALEAATEAVRLEPAAAKGWVLLAKARDAQLNDPWGALSADVRAAWFQSDRLGSVASRLRQLASGPADQVPAVDEILRDSEPGTGSEVQLALQELPLVVRSLAGPVDRQLVKEGFARLEELAERQPTRLVPQLLLGLLAYGVRRDVYAQQYLALVASAGDDLGQVWYLAAAAAARAPDLSERSKAFALEALGRAGGKLIEASRTDMNFAALQDLEPYRRLVEGR